MSGCCLLLGEKPPCYLEPGLVEILIHSDWWLPGSHQVLTLVTGTWLTSLGLLPFWDLLCVSPVRKKTKFKAIVHRTPPTHTHKGHEVAPLLAHPSPRAPLSFSDSTPASAAALDFKVGWHEKLNHQNAFWYQGGKRNSPEGFWF